RALLAMTDQDIRRHLADGQLVLPLDEVVRQMPVELFGASGQLPDISVIESLPVPFQEVALHDPDPSLTTAPDLWGPQPLRGPDAAAVEPTGATPVVEGPTASSEASGMDSTPPPSPGLEDARHDAVAVEPTPPPLPEAPELDHVEDQSLD